MTINEKSIGTSARDYTTPQAWVTARVAAGANFVTGDKREIGYMYNDSEFTTNVNIDGATTDSTRYWALQAADGEQFTGAKNTGARISYDGLENFQVKIKDDYFRVRGIEILGGDADADTYAIAVDSAAAGANEIILSHLRVDVENDGSARAVRIYANNANVYIYNCQILNSGVDNINAAGIYILEGNAVWVYNCTIEGCRYGIYDDDGSAGMCTVKNTVCINNEVRSFFTDNSFNAASTNNAADDTYTIGLVPLKSITAANCFVSITNNAEDLHVQDVDSPLFGAGIDLSADTYLPFADDANHDLREQWSIGAYDHIVGEESDLGTIKAQQIYSVFKMGFLLCTARIAWEHFYTEIGDEVTITFGQDNTVFTGLVYDSKVHPIDKTVIVSALYGGYMADEDGAFA